MKTLKLYSTITTIAIIILSIFLFKTNADLTKSEKDIVKKNVELQKSAKQLKETDTVWE